MSQFPQFLPGSLLSLSLLFASVVAPAADFEGWSLEDVLKRVEEANGGLEAIKEVTNVRILGEIENEEATYDFYLLKKRPNKFRLGLLYKQRSIDTGYDGSVCWKSVDLGSSQTVTELTGEDRQNMLIEADFDGPLIGEPSAGSTRRLIGIERIDRVDYFVIEISGPRGIFHHYVDSRTFRELKVEHYPNGDLEATPRLTVYHDFKRFEGIWVSMRVERTLQDGKKETVHVRDVEINPALLDFIFKMPEEGAAPNP